ncbi:hypothetical protein ACIBBB_04355 [Streptomyces sp. NPDC051217]|uniref:hypothetical protein n=1 Tax=Streptomyces sp. NPDC051217 TaxID=3365644 RepID=UPI0037B92143
MGSLATAAASAIPQAAPVGSPGSLHWWLLVGGGAGVVIALVMSSALYWAAYRWVSLGLETGSFFFALVALAGAVPPLYGAGKIVEEAPSGPPADTSAFLLLLAASVGVGVILVGAFILNTPVPPDSGSFLARSFLVPPMDDLQAKPVISIAVAVTVVVDVLAVLGAIGVLRLNLVKAVAWAYFGLGASVVVAGATVFLIVAVVLATAPGGDSGSA